MTESVWNIRRGVADDAEALALFAARTFEETYSSQNRPEDMAAHLAASFGPGLQATELGNVDIMTVLAETELGLAGFAQVRRNPPPLALESPVPVELWRFYVDWPWQGKGLARALMTEVEGAARGLGGLSVWLSVWQENPKAIRFYEKCGFRIAGTTTFQLGRDQQSDHLMVWDLR